MKKLLYFLLVSFVLISCKDDFDISKLQDFGSGAEVRG